jgi:hypothetical protein
VGVGGEIEIMICEKWECVKIKGRCVFLYLLTLLRSRRTVAAGPPLHVERSSSGYWLWVGIVNVPGNKMHYELSKYISSPSTIHNAHQASVLRRNLYIQWGADRKPTHPPSPPLPPQRPKSSKK